MVQDEISHEGYKTKIRGGARLNRTFSTFPRCKWDIGASVIDSGTPSVKGTGRGASGA